MVPALDHESLTRRFSDDEIKEAVLSCECNKSPRLDGFNFNFLNFVGV